ncbi:TRAP transporter substrate-binding protein DctP [Sulfitobacter sp. PR48]|uniref:TRAP transporter substrate-binding protein n=1 Tax=Sulfitobacter sp. PR48 TaxID=3028383 RepID=UPI00237B038D|nr:TRAP transporter substrate-binding protein DctP [Sulfitobacter sp. PR48]MDD9723428.1 TRAP transporter substrate-binding protein DctP [Sulfitobacter sp. PR48]
MKSHRTTRREFVALSAGAAGVLAMPSLARAQTEQHIKIAYNLPAHHASGTYFEVLAEQIAKRTAETSIKLEPQTFPDGQLYNDAQLPDAISTGAAHIGQVNIGFIAGADAEILRIWAMPFLYETWEAEWAAEDSEVITGTFARQLAKYDHAMLSWLSYGTVEIYTDAPVRLPEDLKGLKLRAFGLDATQLLSTLGASPVTMSSQEIYQALQRGTIDGCMTGPSSVLGRKLYEVTKYGTNAAMIRLPWVCSASAMWWDTLPKDVRAAVSAAAMVAKEASREQCRADNEQVAEELRAKGMEITDPSPEERQAWAAASKPVLNDYLAKNGAEGEAILSAVAEANAAHPVG